MGQAISPMLSLAMKTKHQNANFDHFIRAFNQTLKVRMQKII